MQCQACGSSMEARDKYCVKCGAAAEQITCAGCGGLNRIGSAFCANCGSSLKTGIDHRFDAEIAGELKFVTLMRVDLVRSTDLVGDLQPEEALSRLEPVIAIMRSEARRFGGQVNKELGDGLIAAFGAPLAVDKHAQLACHAAIETMRRIGELKDSSIQARIGLHSGFVVARFVTTEISKVYELTGAAQYLAERLQAAANPGEIYASEACQRLAEGHIKFEALASRSLRGFANPVPVHRVLGIGETSNWQVRSARGMSKFVGRSKEIAALVRIGEETSERGELVCLIGDSGIGKSRLVHEFASELKKTGWSVFEVACGPITRVSPFACLKKLLSALLGPDMTAGASDPGDLRKELPPIWRSAIDAVLDKPVSDRSWQLTEPRLRGRAIAEASCAIVEKRAGVGRLALVFEDLQWTDSASYPAIEAIASLVARLPLLVLTTCRSDEVPDWLPRRNAFRMWLRPLDESAGKAMLDAISGPTLFVTDLKQRILRHTGNVPLFIEEVCRRLTETGVLINEKGVLKLNATVKLLGIPPTLHGVIAARIDRLSADDRAVLQFAAAYGSRLPVSSLQAGTGLSELKLKSSLLTLDRSELLNETSLLPEHIFEFPHDLVRQVAYEAMLENTRQELHRRILEILEAQTDDVVSGQSDTLCHHALRAKIWRKAVVHARAIARKCVARSALNDATSYFEIAFDALDKEPITRERETEAIDLRIESRLAFMAFGRVDRWLELAKEAATRADAIGDARRKVAASAVRAGALNFFGAPLEAIEAGKDAIRKAEELGDRGWICFAEYGLGQAYFVAGRCREAERLFDQSRRRLDDPTIEAPLGTTRLRMQLLCSMMKSVSHAMLGEFILADRHRVEAEIIAESSQRAFDRVAAQYTGGVLLLNSGKIDRAVIELDKTLKLAQDNEIRIFIPLIACNCGIAYLATGLIDQARDILQGARQEAEAVGHMSVALRACIYLSQILCLKDGISHALSMLRGVRDAARQQGYEGLEAQSMFSEAKILASQSPPKIPEIIELLEDSIAVASRIEATPLRRNVEEYLHHIAAAELNADRVAQYLTT